MRIQTLSILAGNAACNASCPFCVSKMTPTRGTACREPRVNWRNFRKACAYAKTLGVTTAMITGKGEPTLFPDQITAYLNAMKEFDFPFIELQTNGIAIAGDETFEKRLKQWYALGLTTVSISVVHYAAEKNKEVYLPNRQTYPNLPRLIKLLHQNGLLVRLAAILANGFIDSEEELRKLIQFARENEVEQLTLRPVNKPKESTNEQTASWVDQHALTEKQYREIRGYLEKKGVLLMKFNYGAVVYDIDGQNVCLTNCLTADDTEDNVRHLIFFPDGRLYYDWQYKGAILL